MGAAREKPGSARGCGTEPPMAAASRTPAPPGGEKGLPLIGRAVLTHRRRSRLCSALRGWGGSAGGARKEGWGPSEDLEQKNQGHRRSQRELGKSQSVRLAPGQICPISRAGQKPHFVVGGHRGKSALCPFFPT